MATAIITGGAIRLGRAMALHLAKKGFNIALLYNSSGEQANRCIKEIKTLGVDCRGYCHDFRKITKLNELMKNIVKDFSDISLLINSASVFLAATIEHTSIDQLYKTTNINLLSPFILMREYKRIVGQGQIINILDQRISKNMPSHAAYSISKVALHHLTILAAVEFGSTIRVNGIAPGLILPEINKDKKHFEKLGHFIPLKKTGDIEALLKGIDYLIDNSFVNGDTLFIDGGESKEGTMYG